MSTMQQTTQRGMTLIETVVAISILVGAITGPLMLATNSLKVMRDAKQEFIATQLAIEGIEVVVSMRSNNSAEDISAAGGQWMQNILTNCAVACTVDIAQSTNPGVWNVGTVLQACPGGDCTTTERMYYNTLTGLYRQPHGTSLGSGWISSVFRRSVSVTEINPGKQVRVISTVHYQRPGKPEGVIRYESDVLNWFPYTN